MRNLLIAASLLLAPLFASANGALKEYSGPTPDFLLSDLDGVQHSLEAHRGKVLMVQFWATYCTPCRTEMPSMNALAEKLGDRFEILAINMGESEADVRRFVDEVKPAFRVLLDPNGRSIQDWKVFAVPSTFIVDPGSNIRYTLYGPAEWDTEEMVNAISALAGDGAS
jgi:thiol-disulfide isomerase/thioredoxin